MSVSTANVDDTIEVMILASHRSFLINSVLMLALSISAAPREELKLINHGKSRWQIIIASNSIPSERYAAEELQHYLEKMTGAKLPIRTDASRVKAHEILLGENAHLRKLGVQTDFDKLGAEGFI